MKEKYEDYIIIFLGILIPILLLIFIKGLYINCSLPDGVYGWEYNHYEKDFDTCYFWSYIENKPVSYEPIIGCTNDRWGWLNPVTGKIEFDYRNIKGELILFSRNEKDPGQCGNYIFNFPGSYNSQIAKIELDKATEFKYNLLVLLILLLPVIVGIDLLRQIIYYFRNKEKR